MRVLKQTIHYGPFFRSAQIEEKALALSPGCAFPEGRTLLFLSDVHLSSFFPARAVERLLMQIDQLHPDMILLGGDYAESAQWQQDFFRMLGQLHPPLGIFGAAGNNDRECFPGGYEPLAEIMEKSGATLLINRTARVSAGDGLISIGGVDELKYSSPCTDPLFDERDRSAFRILLAHYPQAAARYTEVRRDLPPHLCLSGHTHAGQFSLFGLTPFSILFEQRLHGIDLPAVSGWTDVNGSPLLVSPGLGTSKLPFRINADPCIHLIRPVRQEQTPPFHGGGEGCKPSKVNKW